MQQIADWLEKLGMSEYAPRFAENRIDFSVLRELNDQDLKDLGVVLGDRRKMLRAIADIIGVEKHAPAAPPKTTAAPRRTAVMPEPIPTATVPPISAAAEVSGERRYVTVMFCDLVGSTSISAQLDAEEWRDLVSAYLDAACAAVTELGGHLAKKLGDGLMVLFGYPVAQENDAERAARAALSIQRALAEVNRKNADAGKPALNARIGIEIGPVVIDAAGEIYGDAPNVAARVQALAEPGTVVVTAKVQRQIVGLFVAEERGGHELKGVPEPVTLFRLVRASGGGRRAGQRRLTPLVGRDEEIAMLMRRWERARQGNGQLVLIVGEPGIGKSRLMEEFHARLRDTQHTWVEWGCSQLLQNTPLHPIPEWGRQRFGGADVPAERRLSDLENTLALIKLDPAENVRLLAPLLDIPLPPERRPILAPEELRRRQLAALTNWVMVGARAQPIVLILEDLHWADPTTLDVFRGIAERGAMAPLFVLLTARPEFRPPWGVRSHHGAISLVPLDSQQVRYMVGELATRHALAKEVIEGVTERTGGVPLFVEEVTRLLLERGEQGGIQTIPPTLQQSLTARLDRLGPAREVAQIAAVIGRDFSYPLLRAVVGMEDVPLQTALERLAEADILLVQGLPPESEYRFKHALIQDAAYENLLRSRRQILHRGVGEALRDHFAATAAAEPELLAHHFTQAGLTELAVQWWGKAGQRSLERSAVVEAVAQLLKGLMLVANLPEGVTRVQHELDLQIALGKAMIATKGYFAPETGEAFHRARALCEHLDWPPQFVSVLHAEWVRVLVAGDLALARTRAEELLTLGMERNDPVWTVMGCRISGVTCCWLGEWIAARDYLERGLSLYDPAHHSSHAELTMDDTHVMLLTYLAWTLLCLGYLDQARAKREAALTEARLLSRAFTLAHTLSRATPAEAIVVGPSGVLLHTDEWVSLTEKQGIGYFLAEAMMFQGWCLTTLGQREKGMTQLTRGLAAYRAQGLLHVPMYLTLLADAYRQLQQPQNGLRQLEEAVSVTDRTQGRYYEAEIHRVRGELFLSMQDDGAAEASFRKAITVAQLQNTKTWELRAAMSLARLWRNHGKPQQACELLAPVYSWFTEGFDTLDLREAKTLLGELVS
jgi:class 3 adenylate cyclase/tetratricopeptide (TPR) repeat protein